MHRVKLTCSWCDDQTLYDRFVRCYVSKYNTDPNVQFTNSNLYDWLVIINHPRYSINFPKEKTLGVIMEPSWSPYFELRYLLEQSCRHILYHKKMNSSQYIFYPGLLPFHFDYTEGNNIDYYIDNNFTKTKLCSFIVSYNQHNSHSSCLYNERVNFAKQILQTDLDIDIFGNNWEHSGISDARVKGSLINKIDGLIDYKYSIAIENCAENNYFTEKITDCILTDTTPIYYGCPNIELFLNNLYKLSNLSNTTELATILSSSALKQHKTIFAAKYNLYTAITKYIKSIS
jgi:hypothetical protein